MILSDFFWQKNNDDRNPSEIIPISFDMYKILENNLNNIDKINFGNGKYLIQTHSQAKTSGIKLQEVHGVGKSLDPYLRPENNILFPNKEN